jgi:multidrug efflux pump subunit AcrA (membrane-fusion protein)
VRAMRARWMLLVLSGVELAACGMHGKPAVERKAAGGAAPQAVVETGTVSLDGAEVVAPGIVEPWGRPVLVAAREPGIIRSVPAQEGVQVAAGQLLVQLDDEPQRLAERLAEAESRAAAASLARVEHGATEEELEQAAAQARAAQARLDLASGAAARAARLLAEKAVPEADAERAADEARAAAAFAAELRARQRQLEKGARPEDLAYARAQAAAARARLLAARQAVERRRVVSPSSGTVLLSRFRRGERAGPDAPLVVLGDVSRLQVRLEVDEVDAFDLAPGAPCLLTSDGGARLAVARVLRLAPQMGRRALALESPTARNDVRVREVFLEVDGPAPLIPGQRVWARAVRSDGRLALHSTPGGTR